MKDDDPSVSPYSEKKEMPDVDEWGLDIRNNGYGDLFVQTAAAGTITITPTPMPPSMANSFTITGASGTTAAPTTTHITTHTIEGAETTTSSGTLRFNSNGDLWVERGR